MCSGTIGGEDPLLAGCWCRWQHYAKALSAVKTQAGTVGRVML